LIYPVCKSDVSQHSKTAKIILGLH